MVSALCAKRKEIRRLCVRGSAGLRWQPEGHTAHLVGLDAGDDTLLLHQLNERLAGGGVVVQRLLEQDGARDVLAQACTKAAFQWRLTPCGPQDGERPIVAGLLPRHNAEQNAALTAGGLGQVWQ